MGVYVLERAAAADVGSKIEMHRRKRLSSELYSLLSVRQRQMCNEAGTALSHRVCLGIQSGEHAAWQGDTHPLRVIFQQSRIHFGQSPYPAGEFRILPMLGNDDRFRDISPSSNTVSIHNVMDSLALAMDSSMVSPAEKQPGRSGATTPQACVSSPGSMAIGYLMVIHLQVSQLQKVMGQAYAHVLARMRHAQMTGRSGVREDVMRPLHAA